MFRLGMARVRKAKELFLKLLCWPYFVACDYVAIKLLNKVPVFFYGDVKNVGDDINRWLPFYIRGEEPYLVKSKVFSHYIFVGSIMHHSRKKSVVLGSGFISFKSSRKTDLAYKKIISLRGKLTARAVRKACDKKLDVPLGDPALILPYYLQPKEQGKKYYIGIVPHYVDKENRILHEIVKKIPRSKIIDVQSSVDDFVNQICACEYVISSSLHGLILSDAYGIKNLWVTFSDNVIGGRFKFLDYYSTTDGRNKKRFSLRDFEDIEKLDKMILLHARVNSYMYPREKLLSVIRESLKSGPAVDML